MCSALRRTKDSQGRYLVDPDPTNAAGNQLGAWKWFPQAQQAFRGAVNVLRGLARKLKEVQILSAAA
jgi:hypothetical protein